MTQGPPQKLELQLKTAQQLVMTPQLREAIGLLQLNNLELAGYLEKELAENPFLDKQEAEGLATSLNLPETASGSVKDAYANSFDTGVQRAGSGGSRSFEGDDRDLEDTLAEKPSLRDHLLSQLATETANPTERALGALLVDRLDEAGYLRESIDDICAQSGAPYYLIYSLILRLKTFDPTGVFASDLKECLHLQLAELDEDTPAMLTLLENLDLVASADLKQLAKRCGVEVAEVQSLIKTLRRLNPKPASSFQHNLAQTALPDVLMRPLPKHEGGGWKVELNTDTLPRVLMNEEYVQLVNTATRKDDKAYLNDRMNAASWLVKALDQRAQTILKVASAIVAHQEPFFLYGVTFLKPLTLREIAEEIGMHESTVSRVTMGKFIGTPRGLFELKYFFDSGVSGESGTGIAAEAVKAQIKTLIETEDPAKVLSDDDIAAKLNAQGINIARRTVAKYREAYGIPTSSIRRRQKRLG